MLKVVSDLALVKQYPDLPVATLLYPFVGIYPEAFHDPRAPMSTRFDTFVAEGSRLIQLTNREEAECFVFPFEWYGLPNTGFRDDLLGKFFEDARSVDRRGIVFAYGDEHVNLSQYENAIVLQSDLVRSRMTRHDRAMPAFVEDMFRERASEARSGDWLQRLGFQRRPTVSFCGFSTSAPVREAVIRELSRSWKVKPRFTLRERYYGGAWDKEKCGFDYDRLRRVRTEYVDSLYCADYVLCVRGYGNYSARFYEALCCGKIPLLVDTDCALPLEHVIDYERVIVRIDAENIDHAADLFVQADASITDDEFIWRQSRARELWVKHLSPHGFFASLRDVLESPSPMPHESERT
jgi:hypothetical protein